MAQGRTNPEGTLATFMAVAERWNGYRDLQHFYETVGEWCTANQIVLGEGLVETLADEDRSRRHDYTVLRAPMISGPGGVSTSVLDPDPIADAWEGYVSSQS